MLSRAMSILCRHEPDNVMELELDAEFQAQRMVEDPVLVQGRLYPIARTFYFTDGSALSVVDDEDEGFVVVSDTEPKSQPAGGWRH